MKLFVALAAMTAFIILADYSAYHPETKPLFLGIALIAVGVVGIAIFVTRPGVKRGRK